MDESAEPQWMRELRERRRSQSGGRRATPDMLLQQPSPHQHHHHHHHHEGTISEQQEDLTYGPGIVKKLKSRYISLTLRDAPPKPRPALHPLRRAASLEHGLDDEPQQPAVRKYTPKAPAERPARYRPITRAPENVKRARSVDTLVRCDSRSDDEPQSPQMPVSPTTPPPAPSPERTLRPKRPSPLLKETERPPPDMVKTTLKIFEANPVRRTKTPTYTGQVADKVKSYTVQCKPKITAKKPTIPPRSPLVSPDGSRIQVSTQTTPSLLARPPPSPKKLILQNDRDSRDRSVSPVYVNKHPVILTSPIRTDFPQLKHVAPFELKSPELSPTYHKSNHLTEHVQADRNRNGGLLSPLESDVRTSTPDPETPSEPAATEISLISPSTPVHSRKISESSSEDGSYDVAQLNGNDDPPTTKIISKSALENISKAGTTTQFSFGGVNGLNGDAKKSHLPATKPWPTNRNKLPPSSSDEEVFEDTTPVVSAKNPCFKDAKESLESRAEKLTPLTPLLIPNYTMPIPNEIVPLKKVDFVKNTLSPPRIKPPVETDPSDSPALILHESPYNNGTSPLTSREIEKNLINKTKSLEQPVKKIVVSVIDSEIKVVTKSSESPKKPTHVDNSVVPVPDFVKPNIAAPVSNNTGSEAVASASGVVTNGVSYVKSSPKKPHWQPQQQQQQTSMVFNFSNRKEVPDYIENDGLILRSSTRDRPKVKMHFFSRRIIRRPNRQRSTILAQPVIFRHRLFYARRDGFFFLGSSSSTYHRRMGRSCNGVSRSAIKWWNCRLGESAWNNDTKTISDRSFSRMFSVQRSHGEPIFNQLKSLCVFVHNSPAAGKQRIWVLESCVNSNFPNLNRAFDKYA